jgi:hypothetical protein
MVRKTFDGGSKNALITCLLTYLLTYLFAVLAAPQQGHRQT